MPASARPKCIVLPLHTRSGITDASGLGLHFLLGNMMAAHPGLAECWFGWRVRRIFPDPARLEIFCNEPGMTLDLPQVAGMQAVRFWIHGRLEEPTARLALFDADAATETSIAIPLTSQEGWVDFRKAVLTVFNDALGFRGRIDPERMLWKESCTRAGFDAVGKALLAFYLSRDSTTKTVLHMDLFHAALNAAPESFIAPALAGWAWYRSGCRAEAIAAFEQALARNPSGVGALAGLTLCAVDAGDADAAAHWARRKAMVRGEDPDAAAQKARTKATTAADSL